MKRKKSIPLLLIGIGATSFAYVGYAGFNKFD